MERGQQSKRDDFALRWLSRVGSVFRRGSRRTKSTVDASAVDESKKPGQTSTSTSAAKPASGTAAAVVTPAATAPQSSQPNMATVAAAPADNETAPGRLTSPVIPWSEVQQERARALFAKYGLSLEPEEWMSPRNIEVQRVERPIRMRVRRTCHRCQTSFGLDRVCVSCQHVRCKKCPRYPPARTKEEKEARALAKALEKGKQPERQHPEVVEVTFDNSKKKRKPPVTMASRTGGQDLVFRTAKQRVHRTCHQCQSLFQGTSTQCETCGHMRCKICPRDPSKLYKYPDGYPGDEDAPDDADPPSHDVEDPPPEHRPTRVWKKPRMRVRHFCHKCDTIYTPGETICSGCGEERGPATRRDPPKRPTQPFDRDLLKRVQDRLESMRIGEVYEPFTTYS